MKIQKFEAYKYAYRGKGLKSNREDFMQELIDNIGDGDILGYTIVGMEYIFNDEILYLELSDEKNNSKTIKTIKLDLSDVGIEIGTRDYDPHKEEFEEFVPEVNLDTDQIKQMKSYKKSIKNYNL